jgi:hypothetical protein
MHFKGVLPGHKHFSLENLQFLMKRVNFLIFIKKHFPFFHQPSYRLNVCLGIGSIPQRNLRSDRHFALGAIFILFQCCVFY